MPGSSGCFAMAGKEIAMAEYRNGVAACPPGGYMTPGSVQGPAERLPALCYHSAHGEMVRLDAERDSSARLRCIGSCAVARRLQRPGADPDRRTARVPIDQARVGRTVRHRQCARGPG